MLSARWMSALVALLAMGCREAPRDFTEGTFENAESAAGQRTVVPPDRSTDPAVSFLDADASMTATPTDAGSEMSPLDGAADVPASIEPDAGRIGADCDLLSGLLCQVGLLCVDGSCQTPQ